MATSIVPENILLCLTFPENPFEDDFSIAEQEEHTLVEAKRMAKLFGSKLRIVCVLEQYHYEYDEVQAKVEGERYSRTEAALTELCTQLKSEGYDCDFHIAEGIAWYQIIKHAAALSADWIMMSAVRVRRDNQAAPLGSTARKVVRKAEQPVWVIRHTSQAPIKKIAVAIDLGPISQQLVDAGAVVANALNAEKQIVHGLDYRGAFAYVRMPDAERLKDEYKRKVRDNARTALQALCGEHADEWKILLTEHDVVDVLPEMEKQGDADLVVMGSVSRSGVAGLIIGNSAEKLLDKLNSSLLVLKPEGWSTPVND